MKRAYLAVFALIWVLSAASCTWEDGDPWGYVRAELTVPAPRPAAEFEVESYQVELSTVRLIQTQTSAGGGGGAFDPKNPPPGCNLCHGGHCHCDGELVSYEELEDRLAEGGGASRRVLANLDYGEAITSEQAIDLGEVPIGEELTIDTVEVELEALRVDGVLVRDDERIPAVLSLPGIAGTAISAPVQLDIGPGSPERQGLAVGVVWSEDWFEEVDVDALEMNTSGEVLLSSTSNRDAAFAVTQAVGGSMLDVKYEE